MECCTKPLFDQGIGVGFSLELGSDSSVSVSNHSLLGKYTRALYTHKIELLCVVWLCVVWLYRWFGYVGGLVVWVPPLSGAVLRARKVGL